VIQHLIDEGARVNLNKAGRYWYPLSVATFGVDEILAAIDSLCSFRTTMWQKTAEFERRFAESQGVGEAVMVNSGSSADLVIAFALTNPKNPLLHKGDEILIPSVTWPTQIWSAMMAGLRPRFVDTDPRTLNVDVEDLRRKIGPLTRAVSLVHLMGNPNPMDEIAELCSKHGLILIEDCCEALGASYRGKAVGSFGMASAFSFFFSHHMTTMEGGMILTNDRPLSDLLRLLRAHGWARNTKYVDTQNNASVDPRYVFLNWGFNVRPTEIQAAFGLEQLKRLPEFGRARLRNVERFRSGIARHAELMQLMHVLPGAECSWFALPIVLQEACPFSKAELCEYLEGEGVETRPIVAGNLARQPVCDYFPDLQGAELPGADIVHDRGFYLGLYSLPADDEVDRLIEVLDRFVARFS
jgi:CDP-6-deoxy-D-xylo-4-hexulose-3-dehydrase